MLFYLKDVDYIISLKVNGIVNNDIIEEALIDFGDINVIIKYLTNSQINLNLNEKVNIVKKVNRFFSEDEIFYFMKELIDYDATYIECYEGNDKEIIDYAYEKGYILDEQKLDNENIMMLALYKDINNIKLYNGNSEKIFEYAIENGYIPTPDDMKKYNFRDSICIIRKFIDQDINNIKYYNNQSEEIFSYIVNLIDERNYIIPEHILQKSNFASSRVFIKKAIEQNPENFSFYMWKDRDVWEFAAKKGCKIKIDFSDYSNDELMKIAVLQDPKNISYYEGDNEEIFLIASKNYKVTSKDLENYNFRNSSSMMKNAINQDVNNVVYYTGYDESVFELAKSLGYIYNKDNLKQKNFSGSRVVMVTLLEQDIEYIKLYQGNDEDIISLISKFSIKISNDMLLRKNFSQSKSFMKEAIRQNVNNVLYYIGTDEEVFQFALDKGFEISPKILEKKNFVKSETIMKKAISMDKAYNGVRIIDKECGKTEVLQYIKEIITEEGYNSSVDTEEKEESLYRLSSILTDESSAYNFLNSMDTNLINKLGFDNYKTLVKYALNDTGFKDLVNISKNGELDKLLDSYKVLEKYIQDDSAFGINKFLKFVELYNKNSDLCVNLMEKVNNGQELSNIEKTNFQIVIYNSHTKENNMDVNDLESSLQMQRDTSLERLDDENYSLSGIKSDLLKYLFGIEFSEIERILRKDLNTETILMCKNQAIKNNNYELQIVAEYMDVVFEIIEQIVYYSGTREDLVNYANNIYSKDIEKINYIRSKFFNLKEKIRQFYEFEASNQLTDVSKLKDSEEFCKMDVLAGEPTGLKIIDFSNSEYTVYAHVADINSFNNFFTTDRGRATICVSPETDKHEAYYNSSGVKMFFTDLPEGSFIGSSPSNISSNSTIKNNDYRTHGVERGFVQTIIRESYKDGEHGETLLYREGLIPDGIILDGRDPTEIDRQNLRKLNEMVRKIPGQEDYEAVFIRTQGARKRVLNYKNSITSQNISEEVEHRKEEIEEIKKVFYEYNLYSKREDIVRKSRDKSYVIVGNDIYIVDELEKMQTETVELDKVSSSIQKLVHGSDSLSATSVAEFGISVDGQIKSFFGKNMLDRKTFENFDRNSGKLSQYSNDIVLKEFLVDHLLCNYVTDNESFVMDEKGNIRGTNKINSFSSIEEFQNGHNQIYTSMSYLYFDKKYGNSFYRRIFESYIDAEDGDEVITEQSFNEFVEISEKISNMSDEEYLSMFEGYIYNYSGNQELLKKIILERKNTLYLEAKKFVERLNELRKAKNEQEMYENFDTIAIVNDVHGNFEALKSILEDCVASGRKDVYILGDMIGFGPESNQCIEEIRRYIENFNEGLNNGLNIRGILGNHELYSLMGNKPSENISGFDSYSTNKTRKELTSENREFLESLPLTRKINVGGKNIEFTHFPTRDGSYEDWNMYLSHGENISYSKAPIGQDYLIYGHEHRTEYTKGDEVGSVHTLQNKGVTYLNLPSSGCVSGKYASYATLTDSEGLVKADIQKVQYDQEKTLAEIDKKGTGRKHFYSR